MKRFDKFKWPAFWLTASLWVMAMLASPALAYSNLIANSSVENVGASAQPTGWLKSAWGSNASTYSYKATGHTSAHSLRVDVKDYVNGDAKWYFAPVAAMGSTPYIFSDYYKASTATSIVAQFGMQDGSSQFMWLSDQSASATNWKQVKSYLITPPDTTSITILHLISGNGYLQTDSFVLKQPEPIYSQNNISNPSAEQVDELNASTPAAWQKGQWGSNTASFTYSSIAHTGTHSLRVNITNYANGDAKWYSSPTTVESGADYVYSDYYMSNTTTDLIAEYTTQAGSASYQWLGTTGASKGVWKRAAYVVSPPIGTKTLRILHTLAANGYLQIDDTALPKKVAIQVINGVINGNLEQIDQVNLARPAAWQTAGWGVNTTKYTYITNGHNASQGARIDTTSYTDGDAKWMSAPVAVQADSEYTVGDYYRASVDTHVVAQLNMIDGTTQYLQLKNAPLSSSWTQYSEVLSVPPGTASVQIMHLVSSVGWLETDDYSVELSPPIAGFNSGIVSLSFDDGWASVYDNALPLLRQYNFVSTQFIATGLLNTPGYMTNSQILSMYSVGEEIGDHTISHPDLTTLSPIELERELADSQSTLSAMIGMPVTSFASPYGSYNSSVLAAIVSHFNSHRSTDVGYNTRANFNQYNIRNQGITNATTASDVEVWLQKAKKDKSWLVLTYHQVDLSGDLYSTTPASLDAQLNQIMLSGLPVMTITQALAELTSQL